MSESDNSTLNSGGAVIAALHPEESARLGALQALNILDKPSDERFDRLTTLATTVFDVPIALVSLVDENRQWFLSRCGLDATEMGRDVSFCSHALLEDVMLVVEDMREDPRFATNPLVVNPPHVRFYAGVVIHTRDGLPLGTLCLVSVEPRVMTGADRNLLVQLGALVEGEMLPDTARMQHRVQSQLNAQVDPLTRAHLPERFILSVQRQFDDATNLSVAVATVVLPGLDQLNDIFGRVVGDELLIELSTRLADIGKRYEKYSLGRLSGRRFSLSICGRANSKIGCTLLEAINHALTEPFTTSAGELFPDICAGIASAQPEASTVESVLERCRAALATTSSSKGSQAVLYDERHLMPVHRRLRIAAELRNAIDQDALHLVYQPKVRCSDRLIDGFECLLRWEHAELGFVSPLDILDSARDVNQLVALDRWVIDRAIKQQAHWQALALKPGTLSVNITGETLMSPDFVSWLRARLAVHGVNAVEMELEVLESSLFDDFNCAVAVLDAIQALGVGLSLDDFGTGYSSLAYLYRLPISVLKIDRAFISRLEKDSVHRSLCSGILSIAHDLTLSVVAEGVENENQFAILQASNCDRVQGYLFSRPVSACDATLMLQSSSGENNRAVA